MNFDPGHDYWVRYASSASTGISNTTGLISGAVASTSATDIGYTSPGNVTIDDGTRNGFASGSRGALYGARGGRTVSITIPIRIGMGEFVSTYCLPDGDLPEVDLYYGISGQWARGIHKAKCSRVSIHLPMNDGAEVTATATFEGIAYQSAATVTVGFDYEEFGPALLATDVRSLVVGAIDWRENVMDLTFDVDYQLERKGIRPEFGHDVPGSRTSYALLAHHQQVSGSVTMHDLPTNEHTLFWATSTSMNWGDIVALISDLAGTKTFDFTLTNPRPVSRSQNEIESAGQMNWTVPFIASSVTCVAVDVVEEEEG